MAIFKPSSVALGLGTPLNPAPQGVGGPKAPPSGASYRALYGAPPSDGRGPLAPYLGDPAKFPSTFKDNGGYWIVAPDENGNPFFILVKGPDGAELYNFPQVRKRNLAGYQAARDFFRTAEAATAYAAGLSLGSTFLALPLNDAASRGAPNLGAYGKFIGGGSSDVGLAPQDTSLHVFRGPIPDVGDPEARIMGTDLGPATPFNTQDVGRAVNVRFVFKTADGVRVEFLATVNTRLRMGYITGFPGVVTGGDDWIPQAIKTLVDVVEIVVGIYTANVGLILAALADIVVTWYSYLEAAAAADANAFAKGAALAGAGQGGGPVMKTAGQLAAAKSRRTWLLIAGGVLLLSVVILS